MKSWIWIVKINGKREAAGWCDTKEEALSECGRYFAQYSTETYDKISLEIKRC